jgi:tRNA pseudouridine65 synthase
MLEILYQDENIVAVNKPSGMLVHKTAIAAYDEGPFAMQTLRDQLGKHVYTIHRLDRPTSGVLLFATNSTTAKKLQEQFEQRQVSKTYLTVCRGYTDESGEINDPLMHDDKNITQEAITRFQKLAQIEMPYAISRYPTSRYSLVRVQPLTGRMHQIRKHFAKMRHYLIGDSKHGDLKHNRYYAEHLGISGLLLHAEELQIDHPETRQRIVIKAPIPEKFKKVFELFGWSNSYSNELPNMP